MNERVTFSRGKGGYWDRSDVELRVREILDRKLRCRGSGPYAAKTNVQVIATLEKVFKARGLDGVRIAEISRMAGGASKEQFSFLLKHAGDPGGERLVLRMDPLESIAQTCRGREAQIQSAMHGIVPVAPVIYVDAEGTELGQPGLIAQFVHGVTKPSDISSTSVSGIGVRYDAWAGKLAPQFVDCLARIHGFDWRSRELSYFSAPTESTTQAALRQVNWWSRVWWEDLVEPVPIVTLAERWLRENALVCESPVVVHGDYRIGNFMFEEPSGRFTAVLDWELAHIGDLHEDIAWVTQRLFGTWREDGEFLVCGLLPRQEFIEQYEARSGNRVDQERLRYYEVLNAYKCAVMALGAAMRTALHGNNHQDLVLTWLGSAGAVHLDQIVMLLESSALLKNERHAPGDRQGVVGGVSPAR